MTRTADTEAVYAALCAADPDVMDRDELVDIRNGSRRSEVVVRLAQRSRDSPATPARCRRPRRVTEGSAGPGRRAVRKGGPRRRRAREGVHGAAELRGRHSLSARSLLDMSMPSPERSATSTRRVTAEFVSHADELLADAERMGVDAFDRSCRDLARQLNATHAAGSDADELDKQRAMSKVRRWTDATPGCATPTSSSTRSVTPNCGPRSTSIAGSSRQSPAPGLTWEQLQVEALIAAVTAGGESVVQLTRAGRSLHAAAGAARPVGVRTLRWHPLPVSTVRQMACEAEIIPIVLDGDGRALDVGRGARLANRSPTPGLAGDAPNLHRTQLRRSRSTIAESTTSFRGNKAGATDLSNLAPLCESAQASPSGPRRRLEADDDSRPDRDVDPTRRHVSDGRPDRPSTRRLPAGSDQARSMNAGPVHRGRSAQFRVRRSARSPADTSGRRSPGGRTGSRPRDR